MIVCTLKCTTFDASIFKHIVDCMEQQKQVLITGASSGIGFETALHLSRDTGYSVFATARSDDKLQRLHEVSGEAVTVVPFDLVNGDPLQLKQQLVSAGLHSLHGLVHNAGFLVNRPFSDISSAELETCYRTNVMAPFLLTQSLLPELRRANGAHVIHIGSVGGVQGSVKFPGLSAYSSSKGALSVLTECLALELEPDKIRFNCLALGAVQTEMLGQAFPGYEAPLKAHEMGEFISWFLVHGHRYFNGKILPVALSTP